MLNGIHEELVELKKLVTPSTPITNEGSQTTPPTTHVENGNGVVGKNEDEDSWEQVGRKNKSSTMRKVCFLYLLIFIYFSMFSQ